MPTALPDLVPDRRSLLPGVALLAGIVVALAGLHAAQGLFATVAFGALAAVICRRLQLGLQERGLGRGWSLTITVVAFVIVIGLLAAAFVASIIALVVELGGETDALAEQLQALAESFGLAAGLPPASVPAIDVGQLLSAARSLLGAITPAVTGLLMAGLILTYLLYDADRLRVRMLRTLGEDVVSRYDVLANELWVYIKVRAILGAAAAVADTVLLLVLGVPYAVLWGVVSFLFSFVPNIGFVLALIPPAILAFLDGGPGPALLVVGGYVAINLAFDYVLQPRVMATELAISPVITIVSILFWTFVIGPTGALLAVPLTIVLRTILMPFPQAHWFVALLGPIPGEDVPEPGSPARTRRPGRHPRDPRAPTLQSAGDHPRPRSRRVSGHVFRRTAAAEPPVAVSAHGSTIVDADGREYLDAAGGAVVVNIGHGRREVADAAAAQAATLAYAHGSAFTTEAVERYAAAVGEHLPMDEPYLYPVSGGSEAVETAIKLARAIQLARGERDRSGIIARWGSYHGNTLGALDLSGRKPLRAPYEAWLGRFAHVSAAYPYRGGLPGSGALGSADALAAELDATIRELGPSTVAAFIAEPIVGATLGAVEPPDGYWPAIAEVCRRHGVLLIADEVMTGFGRTGTWFAMDGTGVRPDLLVAAKGATSGYWPFGFCAVAGEHWDAVTRGPGFVHGFTYSHQPVARGGRGRGAADPRGGGPGRGIGHEGGSAARAAGRAARRARGGRRHPRARADGRRGAGARPAVEGRVPALGEARGGRGPGGAGARAAALLGDRQRRRRRRRRGPARAAVRGHGRRAGPDRRRPGRGPRRGPGGADRRTLTRWPRRCQRRAAFARNSRTAPMTTSTIGQTSSLKPGIA